MANEAIRRGDSLDDEDAAFDGLSDEARIHRLLARELGQEMADAFVSAREVQERWERRRHQDGLRERKKRRTRQQISDVATALFVVRGFDRVRVSEIAEIVGVSEKTVYNYFPTKESLVFDRADEGVERLAAALRAREPGESPTKAMLRALNDDMEDVEDYPDEIYNIFPLFAEMVAATPSLRAALLDLQSRLVEVATEELAAYAGVDPRDPEPAIAARAIVGLQELAFGSRMRHIESGLRGRALREAVQADLERAARLLDTGLSSFERTGAALSAAQRRAAKRSASRSGKSAMRAARKSKSSIRDARTQAERAAYEAFRQSVRERQQTLRERQRTASKSRASASKGNAEEP